MRLVEILTALRAPDSLARIEGRLPAWPPERIAASLKASACEERDEMLRCAARQAWGFASEWVESFAFAGSITGDEAGVALGAAMEAHRAAWGPWGQASWLCSAREAAWTRWSLTGACGLGSQGCAKRAL
jgi:hypothetical protein